MKEEMIKKFELIKEIMKNYLDICDVKCEECPFEITVGYERVDCEVKLCDALDKIL